MTVAAIIPARGGSKGLPGKNLLPVGGLSLVARAIRTAQTVDGVDRVIVSTDSDSIADEAQRFGAEVSIRPDSIAGDTASSESAIIDTIEQLPPPRRPQAVVFLQCTSPFTRARDVEGLLSAIGDRFFDSAFLASVFHGFVWGTSEEHAVGINHNHQLPRVRRQERAGQYLETGAGYAFLVDSFLASESRFCGHVGIVEMPTSRSLEIDTFADYELACHMAGILDSQRDTAQLSPPVPRGFALPELLILDFDGVFTDNQVWVSEDGTESVACDRGDGHAISRLAKEVDIVVLSTESNPVVGARCRKLGIECWQGLGDRKVAALRELVANRGVDFADVMYVGNDVNDLECMSVVGSPVAVGDAVAAVKAASNFVLSSSGGRGALRELAEVLQSVAGSVTETDRTGR